jgi:hypothetical protein
MNPRAPQPGEDDDVDPEEIQAASDETPTEIRPPEVDPQAEALTAWDEPPSAKGIEAPKILPEDEATVAEQLVTEGADEADREQRMASADPDFEP